MTEQHETDATDKGSATNAEQQTPPPGGEQNAPGPDMAELQRVIDDLGLKPGQIAGRLEASKTWERRAKASDRVDRADYDALKAELDKAKSSKVDPDQIRDQIKAEIKRDSAIESVGIHIRAQAVAGRFDDTLADNLVDTLNLERFLTDSGDVDTEKLNGFLDTVAPQNTRPVPGFPSQGARDGGNAPSRAEQGRAEAARRFGNQHQ